MLAVDLDSNSSGDGTYVSSWTYLNDSAVANVQSAPNKKSQITPSNRMNIRVRYLGRVGVEACMILGDGEQFAGNSYDTTNYVRVYAYGEEVGRFSYKPGISKQTDSAFVQTPEAFVDCLGNIVLLRLKQRLLPVAHSFTVLMLSLHWQRENKK